MAKRIIFSRTAYADIDRIVEFNNLRNRSERYSKKFAKNLQIHLTLLSRNPLIGLTTDDPEVLVSVWNNYYVFKSIMKVILKFNPSTTKRKM